MDPLSWISAASSLAGSDGGMPSMPAGGLTQNPSSFADGQAHVNNQFTTGAFALGGSASSGQGGGLNWTPILIGVAALAALYFVGRKFL